MIRTRSVPASVACPSRRAMASRVAGVTLIELMITLAVAGIAIAVGVPSFMRTLARHAIASQAEELQDAVRLGRNEAMKRSGPVVLCRTDAANASHCAGSGGSWQTWVLFTDLARSGAFVAGDAIVRQHVDVSGRMSVTSSAASIRFESTGIAHSDNGAPVVFVFAPAGAAADSSGSNLALQRQVCVNPRGEVVVIAGGATCP
ncbi:GspH/FimT family pseudopilin [Scleromatobacter humisilvae]|uniref:Type II secretion system protein H n=1 Tax=Scleromatobacter humisilvae TaxID=2897159 RepID=A0A9X1YN95_9BURK|nr:GspH/FimT family pseudopilin [Scleromatobacter humisilvae]MCK9687838.1 GspH/FimT family pseudopilin [Scleromatobacter humisilvae]